MASLIYSFANLYDDVSQFLGTYGSSGASGQDLTDAKNVVNAGYRRFLSAYDWSFLRKFDKFTTTDGVWEYELPEDFGQFIGEPHFSSNDTYRYLLRRDYGQILEMKALSDTTSYPEYFAIRAGEYEPDIGQRQIIGIFPKPDTAYTLLYFYSVFPAKLEATTDVPIGPLDVMELIRAFCLAEAERFKDEKIGTQEAMVQILLRDAVRKDVRRRPNSLGYFGDGEYEVGAGRGQYRTTRVTFTE